MKRIDARCVGAIVTVVVAATALAGCYEEQPAPEPVGAAPATEGNAAPAPGPGAQGQSYLGKAKGAAERTVGQADAYNQQLEAEIDEQ